MAQLSSIFIIWDTGMIYILSILLALALSAVIYQLEIIIKVVAEFSLRHDATVNEGLEVIRGIRADVASQEAQLLKLRRRLAPVDHQGNRD
jgi:hypothetical protein